MTTNKEALAAARTLRDYCKGHKCSACIFNAEDNLKCEEGRIPDEWDLLETRLPESAKEHLMQRFMRIV